MMPRRFIALLVTATLAAWALPALAESIDPELLKPIEPPSTLPRALHGDKTQNCDRQQGLRPCHQVAKRHYRHTAGFHRGVESACNRVLHQKRLWSRACRYS